MGSIVSVHSYRGGTGKSNVVANVAWLLARSGRRVAVVDTDLQSPGVHMVFEFDPRRLAQTLTDFLFDKCSVEEAAYDLSADLEVDGGALFLLPASMQVDAISRIIADGYDVGRLHDQLHQLMTLLDLDLLMLDTHPGLNRETMFSTSVSDLLLVLLRPDTQDFHGTAVMLKVARALGVPKIFLAANKVAQSLDHAAVRGEVEKAFAGEVLGMLPLSEEMATLGSAGLFVRRYPAHPISVELQRIADRLDGETSS